MKRPKLPKGKPPSRRDAPVNPLFNATHEAGHAVANVALGIEVRTVDIRPISMQGGHTSLGRVDGGHVENEKIAGKGAEAVRQFLIAILAGPVAEARVNPSRSLRFPDDPSNLPDWHDLNTAYRFAITAICEYETTDGINATISVEEQRRKAAEVRSLLEEARDAAEALLTEHEEAVRQVATLLMKRKLLTGPEVVAVVNGCKGPPA